MSSLPLTAHFLERRSRRPAAKLRRAFTLVELLITVAVIGILASLVIGQIANAAQESRRIVSRQQQVVVQNAVNAWVLAHSSGIYREPVTKKEIPRSLNWARTNYNVDEEGKARTGWEKLELVWEYLDDETRAQFKDHTGDEDKLCTDAMKKTGRWLKLPEWESGATTYPQVDLVYPEGE